MSPRQARRYRPPRARREVVAAVLSVLGILVFTAVMVWVLAPSEESGPSTPPVSVPASSPTTPSLPPDTSLTTLPAGSTLPPTSAPGE